MAVAQDLAITLSENTSVTARGVQLFMLVTLLSLAPGLAMMVTCFPFIVTVLSILRQAIGLQQAPPNMLIISLALFLSYFIMAPVFEVAWAEGILPLMNNDLPLEQAMTRAAEPFRGFMTQRVDPDTLARIAGLRPVLTPTETSGAIPFSQLLPSFLLSEIARAFQIGFIIYLPFLIIDLVVATVLMSMGMMMVPPVVVSLPFKLAFFVVADGWTLISESLVRGYL
ncbi:flagellar type III secretion system pore protein FliP [Cognatishimia sp. WU-CL00825]|uniref:flagellar type III secretion system pore protein FliP n=1 Tax=Cognatishimia sp. WU-CL00825 TaxID=3127658 RepID=UPI003365A28B